MKSHASTAIFSLLLVAVGCSGIRRSGSEADALHNCDVIAGLSEELCEPDDRFYSVRCEWSQFSFGLPLPTTECEVSACEAALIEAAEQCAEIPLSTMKYTYSISTAESNYCCDDAPDCMVRAYCL